MSHTGITITTVGFTAAHLTDTEVRVMSDKLEPEFQEPQAPTTPIVVEQPPGGPATVAEPAAQPAEPSGALKVWRAIDRGPQAKPWRVLSIVLLVLGCVLAPIGVTAGWAKNLVTNQDAYLEAVSPLITDPVIISAAETRTVDAIDDAITNLQIADKVGDELQSLGLPPKLATLATGYLATFRADITAAITKMVDELFNSPKLATVWNNANAKAHSDFVQIMQGKSPGELHTINVDLSSAVTEIKQKLTSSGVSWAAQIPDIPVVFNIAGNADMQQLAGYYDLLNTLGTLLPILAALLLILSFLIAPSRLGGLSKAAGWLAFSMIVLTLGMLAGREWLVSQAPTQPAVTEAFIRQLTVNLQSTVRTIVIVAAVVSLLAWLFGRSRSAVGLRTALRRMSGRVQDSRWQLAARIAAGVIALVLVLVLVSASLSFVWAVLVALLAGLAAVVAASSPKGPVAVAPAVVDQLADTPERVG
jgi:hypothetical protein